MTDQFSAGNDLDTPSEKENLKKKPVKRDPGTESERTGKRRPVVQQAQKKQEIDQTRQQRDQ